MTGARRTPHGAGTRRLNGPEFDAFIDDAELHLARPTITRWLDAGQAVAIYRYARQYGNPPMTEWRLIPFDPPTPEPAPHHFILRATYERP